MDNDSLNRLLNDDRQRQYWLKAVGPPGDDSNYNRPVTFTFTDAVLKTHFTKRQLGRSVIENITDGDILIAYWTGIKKLIYVAECQGGIHRASPEDIQREKASGRDRWCLYWSGINLTPQYGEQWHMHKIYPWKTARHAFLEDYEKMLQYIRAARHGIAPISQEFAKCLIMQIAGLSISQPEHKPLVNG
ncbi:MAG TPA: hypothetical protein VGP68_01695 [Gemmataceae bacterium]|nr:hypothetical protein [Gemmataceae bacterium]